MDVKVYADIIRDIKSINQMNVNDTYFNTISKKYPSIPEETLRSIINLWFQRKVTHTAHRVKDVNMYDLYQKLLASKVKDACWQIAIQLDYPPSLVAKIVLSSYVAKLKFEENSLNSAELKSSRKQPCLYCRSLVNKSTEAERKSLEEVPVKSPDVKKHHDPRVELALNLFDENDEIGKYFLEKFTFTNNKVKKHSFIGDKPDQNKSNKFFWQASSFEEMGEKNVKKFANVEKLFNDRLSGSGLAGRFAGNSESITETSSNERSHHEVEGSSSDVTVSLNRMNLENTDFSEDVRDVVTRKSETRNNVKIDEQNFSVNGCLDVLEVNSNNNSTSTSEEVLNECKEKIIMQICTCMTPTLSDNSDSDSDDSDEAYENFSIKELIDNPSLIDNPVLARDVFRCTTFDDQYGPTSDIMCSSSGITYEKLLEVHVNDVGLAYKTENNLRGDGFDKTPDIILLVPVAVKNFVINWIESKAQFADYKLHQDFEKRQFQNYVNRFGPGLVIYWHGYVSDVLKSDLVDKQIIISDRFPPKENFTFVRADKFKSWMQRRSNNCA